jgi:hypothetical protein
MTSNSMLPPSYDESTNNIVITPGLSSTIQSKSGNNSSTYFDQIILKHEISQFFANKIKKLSSGGLY